MKRWALGLVGAVLALALALPLLLKTIEQASCGGSAAGAIGAGSVGQQSASGGFSSENVTIAKAAAVEAAGRRLPARALIVILATGFQESGVRNLNYGDRDSVGWLQQRAGWGSVDERMNPQTAAGKFYDHLVRVPGWETLPVTVAAQRVQISAFPDAYAKWQTKAEQLAAIVSGGSATSGGTTSTATTTTAKAAIVAYAKQAGAPSTPHLDPEGLPAFDLMSSGGLNSTIAEELRSHHDAYGARYVISQMRIASPRSNWAWRPYSPITGSGDFEHTRHVHISYTDGPVSGTAASAPAGAGCTGMPAVRIATWNSYYGSRHDGAGGGLLGNARVLFAMAALGKEADIIGGQEFSEASHKRAAMDGLGEGWAATAMDTSHPIFYRKTFELVSSQSVPVFKRGTPMEGPDQGDRYVNTAVLREIATGKTVTEVNFHQLPTIQKNGKLNTAWPKRIAVARRIFTAATDSAQAHIAQGGVLVTCDCNYDGDPEGMFKAAGLASTSAMFGDAKQASRKRDIDQILYSGGIPMAAKVLPAFGSDHSARVVTFPGTAGGVSAAGGGPVPTTFNQQGNPRTVEQAVAWMQANMPNGAPGEPVLNACERYQNLAYGLPGGYPTALAHWNAAGPKSKGYSTPPRGALVFWRSSNPAGHVALSLGNGMVVSTDYNAQTHRYQAGMLSAGPITDIDRWGERLGWRAPNFRVGSEAA